MIEKTSPSEIKSKADLRALPDDELLELHRRLHQWYANTSDKAEYGYYRLHSWVAEEMRRRGMNHNRVDGLDARVANEIVLSADLRDYVLVPDYVSIVGSAATEDDPQDIDVLLRDRNESVDQGWRESVMLLVRKRLAGIKMPIHILCNPSGPHLAPDQKYIPLFDLVLRPKNITKSASELPEWQRWLEKAPSGEWIDIGPGPEGSPPGFRSLGRPYDLDKTWPLEDSSISVLRANHVLEHLRDPARVVNEIWRVLKPGGIAVITVPDARSPGAVAHPEHKSFWVPESFLFWTRPDLLSTVERPTPEPFTLLYLARREENGLSYVDAVLQKPNAIEKQELKPIAHFTPPKPAMKDRMHTEAFRPEEIADWFERHKNEGIYAEPKLNGFRAIFQHSEDDEVSLFFEDSQKERWNSLRRFLDEQKILELPSFILDCDVGVVERGRRWPRVKIMALTSDDPELPAGASVAVTAFDVLYWDGEDVHEKLFADRRALLEKIAPQLKNAGIEITPITKVETLDDIRKAWESAEFGRADMSEGVVLKAGGWEYNFGPSTDGMAKIKHCLELKMIVLDVTETKNGQWHYKVGLLPGKAGGATEELNGVKYVPAGDTLNSQIKASKGDIITVEVEELVVDGVKIAVLDGKVIDIDKERDEPYYAAQSIDLAERAHVLNVKTPPKVSARKSAPAGEGEETRSEAAEENWHKEWQVAIPVSGKPQPYIVHMHWRGLTQDEAKLSLDELLKTDNSVHYDLRLGTDRFNGWWGISLFAGRAKDNRPKLKLEKMLTDPEVILEGAVKQFGPKGWLTLGLDGPVVTGPGEVGAASKSWAKFFAVDHGTYQVGFAREHAVELWFDGKILKGRYMLQYAQVGGKRIWLFSRPQSQEPYAQSHDPNEVLEDLRQKGQKYLFWPKDPSDLAKGLEILEVKAKGIEYRVLKTLYPERVTIGIIYPANETDAHGDWASKETVEKACWRFNRKLKDGLNRVGLFHRPDLGDQGEIIESAIYRGPDCYLNGQLLKNGDWVGAVQWRPEAFELIVKGEVTGLSIQGYALKEGQ